MSRRAWISALVLAGLFWLLLYGVTRAGKPQQLDLSSANGFRQFSHWVEQQDDWPKPTSPITNPIPSCFWAVNDHAEWSAGGHLDPGSVTSKSACVISDFNPVYATRNGITAWWSMAVYGFANLRLLAPSPALLVSVCYQPQDRCFTPQPIPDGRDYRYEFCGRANYDPDDPALANIAGSNGGRGVVTTVTWSVENPTDRRVRGIWVSLGVSSDIVHPVACDPYPPQQFSGPFQWRAS